MIGIEIIGTGEFLELFEDTVIDLKLKNPLFADDDIIPGSIGLPFDVPGGQESPTNSRLLKNPDVVTNLLAPVKTPARIWYEGTPWKKGVLIVTKASPRVISLTFRFGLTTTTDDFKNIRIRDLVDEVVEMNTDTWFKKIAFRLTQITLPHMITINGKDYEFQGYSGGVIINGTTYSGFANTMDGVAEAFSSAINTTFPNGVVAEYASGYCTVRVTDSNTLDLPLSVKPAELQHWLINSTAFASAYNDPIKDFLDNLFNPETAGGAGPLNGKIRFPIVSNKLHDNDLIFQDAVNLADTGGFVLNKPIGNASLEPENRSSICPFVRWRYVLDEVLAAIGLPGAGDFLDDSDFNTGLMAHSNSLDVLCQITGSKEWVATRSTFNIKDFVPDWTIPDFLKALQKRFNVGVDFNASTMCVEFNKREAIHADRTYNDISGICMPIENIEPTEVTGVRIKTTRNTKDLMSSEDVFESGTPGPTNPEVISEISGWSTQAIRSFVPGISWDVPIASIKKDTTITPAMLFYTERETTGSATLLYAAADIDLSDCTFAFAGASGMANVRWKKHLRFLLNRKLIPLDIAFEFRDLLSLDWKKKVRPVEGLNCFINSIDVRLTMHGVERSKCELWTTDLGILP